MGLEKLVEPFRSGRAQNSPRTILWGFAAALATGVVSLITAKEIMHRKRMQELEIYRNKVQKEQEAARIAQEIDLGR